MYRSFIIPAVVLGGLVSYSNDAKGKDSLFDAYHINPVEEPRSLRETARQCMYTNETCAAFVDAIAAYGGVPPGAIAQSMRFADEHGFGAVRKKPQEGEQHTTEIEPPAGYFVCNAKVDLTSLAPTSGKYSPTFTIEMTPEKVSLFHFVHILKPGEGRSWWDGQITLEFRKTEAPMNGCLSSAASASYRHTCKGNSGGEGYPGCSSIDWIFGWPEALGSNPNATLSYLYHEGYPDLKNSIIEFTGRDDVRGMDWDGEVISYLQLRDGKTYLAIFDYDGRKWSEKPTMISFSSSDSIRGWHWDRKNNRAYWLAHGDFEGEGAHTYLAKSDFDGLRFGPRTVERFSTGDKMRGWSIHDGKAFYAARDAATGAITVYETDFVNEVWTAREEGAAFASSDTIRGIAFRDGGVSYVGAH